MATINKDFKIKHGLIVEGTTGTIDNYDILTKKQDDVNYIVDLIGGTSTSQNTPDTVVKRDANGDFAAGIVTADLVGDVTGNADTATALETARTIELTGDVTGSVSFNGTANVQISTLIDGSFATDAEVAAAKGEAISDAQDYTDGRETAITTAYQAYADQAETDAVASANSYTDGRETAITTAYQSYADQAEVDAKAYADSLAVNYDAAGSAATAEANAIAAAESYTDTAVANLVDSAPATLDTLNELAAALQDNPDIISDLQGIAAGKQDALTAGSNISIDGSNVISVTGLSTDDVSEFAGALNQYFTNDRAVSAVVGLNNPGYYSLIQKDGKAGVYKGDVSSTLASTQSNGSGIAVDVVNNSDALAIDRTTVDTWYDAAGTATSEISNALAAGGSINQAIATATPDSTDDLSEGVNNLYYTDDRAKAAIAAALNAQPYVMAPDNHVNVEVVYSTVDGEIRLIAENGVADSTTDDLTEGSSNLYFTDARAVSALEAVTPDFPAVEIASVAKQVAASAEVATASTNTAVSWLKADYRSAEFLVKIANGTHTEVSKVILTLDTSDNVAITEYAMVGTNGSLGSVSADVSGNDVRVRVTTDNNNSTVTVVGTLLA